MARVYVGNLDPAVTARELEDEFRLFGVLRRFQDERPKLTMPVYQKQAGLAARKLGVGKSGKSRIFLAGDNLHYTKIIDPTSDFILMWNYVFRISCFIALFMDPLFFYVPIIVDEAPTPCVGKDRHLAIIITVFRSIVDLFYVIQIVIKFMTAYINPNSKLGVFGRGDVVTDPNEIAKKYLRSDIAVDLVASLPVPQIITWSVIPAIKYSWSGHNNDTLFLVALFQYILRLYLIFSLNRKIVKVTGAFSKTAWQGAVSNLLLYMTASHVLGALWYLLSVDRQTACWQKKCGDETSCHNNYLACNVNPDPNWANNTTIFTSCDAKNGSFDYEFKVPFFSQMDDQLLDAICGRLVSSLSTKGTYTVREGDPVTEMLFIIRGKLESSTTDGGRTGFFNSITLKSGDFCGEELLGWALVPRPTVNLPSSTRTVKALVEVEAFALQAEDLKFVASQFRRLHSRKLQHTFRYYSHHWRTWAACFIQATWRRHKRRKLAKDLMTRESFSSMRSDEDDMSPEHNLARKIMTAARKGADSHIELPKFRKPSEPDFSVEHDD